MASTTQAKLDITSTVKMNSGYEMPVLGYGVSQCLQTLPALSDLRDRLFPVCSFERDWPSSSEA